MRKVSCGRCGKPGNLALCDSCRKASYGSNEYSRNAAAVTSLAGRGILQGHPVQCIICKLPITKPEHISVEHIIPVLQGGDNSRANLAAAHRHCNYGKAAYR